MANVDERIFYIMCMYLAVNKFMYTKWLMLDESHISCKLFSNCEKELLDNVHYYFFYCSNIIITAVGRCCFCPTVTTSTTTTMMVAVSILLVQAMCNNLQKVLCND